MSKTPEQPASEHARKVLIVDDHPLFRNGLAQLINDEPDLEVTGCAGSASQGLKAVRELDPDLVLVDLTLPDRSGLELIREIPMVSKRAKMLVVSMHDEALYANRVLALGAGGYIMKQEDPDEIISAIRDVLSGHIYVSECVLAGGKKASQAPVTDEKERPLDRLSDSELELLELLGQGKSGEEIGAQLGQTPLQVDAVFAEIRKKLKIRHQNGLIRYAVCWVEAGED